MTDNIVYPHYTMDGLELEHTDDMQDLGVMVDNKLTWINHIYKTIRKSHARAWLCMRALGFHAYRKAKKACYITMVRSIMEYASPIWSPTYKYLLVATESVQRRATNYILKNPKRPNPLHINYKERLLQLNLLPLTYRREIIDLQTFLKIWNSNNKLGLQNVLSFSEPNQGRITRAMARGLTLKYSKTRYVGSAHFFPFRVAKIWNKLPMDLRLQIRHMNETNKIKPILNRYYNERLIDHYDPDSTCTWVHHCDCATCKPV